MDTLQKNIHGTVDAFVDQITAIAHRAAVASLESALGRSALTSSRQRRVGRRHGTGQAKRTAADLAAMSAQFAEFVGKHPGLRIEQINKQLGTSTRDLALPIRKLIEDNLIQTKGQKRATTYFASNGARA